MSDVALEGFFTVGDGTELHPDRYVIERVTKVKDGVWRFSARVQYNKKDFPVALNVPVFFAGDTPVMSLTRQGVQGTPGLFDTRLVIYKGGYAGTWAAAPPAARCSAVSSRTPRSKFGASQNRTRAPPRSGSDQRPNCRC